MSESWGRGIMNFQLEQSLAQKLTIGLEQRVSLEVLCKGVLELREYILRKAQENPFLVVEENIPPEKEWKQDKNLVREAKAQDHVDSSERFLNLQVGSRAEEGFDPLELIYGEQYFKDYLLEQLHCSKLDEAFGSVCEYIIENLNDRGYLDYATDNIAIDLEITDFDVRQALYFVQTLHPSGVGARSLKECLLLQLMEGKNFGAHTIKLIQEGLELLAEGSMNKIMLLLECSYQEALDACNVIKQLNPIPSRGFRTQVCDAYIVPDAQVELLNGGFKITMNEYAAPKVSLDDTYCSLLRESGEVKGELSEKIADAKQMINSVHSRYDTLYAVIVCILNHQREYFINNEPLKPLLISDVANELGYNASTVSRAVQGKYIYSKATGTILLKSLFSKAIAKEDGENTTALEIKQLITRFVSNEDTSKPLTDDDIAKALKTCGVSISRRTVAKYRDELGIKSSSKRKVPHA